MNAQPHSGFQPMSPTDFEAFGVGQIAYVKTVINDGQKAFAIHAANGLPISLVSDRDVAVAMIRQNDLEPFSAH